MRRQSARMGRGKKNQLAAAQFTPTSDISVAQLNKVDGTLELVAPAVPLHFGLPWVYLHE